MKKYILFSICFVLFLGFASFAADVVKDSAAAGAKNADKIMSAKDKLGLTDEQSAKLKAINADLKQKNTDLVKQTNVLSKGLSDIMNADDPDLKKAEVTVRELEKVRTQIMLNRLSAMKEVDKVLTKEQRAMMKQMRTAQPRGFQGIKPKGK
jgi:Spy/CpxP family protein refolding chaperone